MTVENLNFDRQIKLIKFFDEEVSPELFAQIIRRYNHEISLMMIRDNQNNVINKQWIDDGFYWLNELAEIIDPNLS